MSNKATNESEPNQNESQKSENTSIENKNEESQSNTKKSEHDTTQDSSKSVKKPKTRKRASKDDDEKQKKEENVKAVKAKPTSSSNGNKNIKHVLKEFLLSKVRPYPLTELITTFKKGGTKQEITNALNELAEKKVLIKKEYGKTVMFLGSKQPSNLSDEEIDELQKKCDKLKAENDKYKEEIKKYKEKYNELCTHGTNEEIEDKIKIITNEIEENRNRISDLSGGKVKIEKKDMEAVDKELNKVKKILKERKEIYKNILDCMIDNSGMKKSELLEEVGIDNE